MRKENMLTNYAYTLMKFITDYQRNFSTIENKISFNIKNARSKHISGLTTDAYKI